VNVKQLYDFLTSGNLKSRFKFKMTMLKEQAMNGIAHHDKEIERLDVIVQNRWFMLMNERQCAHTVHGYPVLSLPRPS
jgi:hypothetical protein